MEWTKIQIHVDPIGFEAVSNFLVEAGSQGVEFLESGVVGYLPRNTGLPEVLTRLQERLALIVDWAGPSSIYTEHVAQEEWAHSWKKYYHPLAVGSRLLICPSWEKAPPGREVVYLDPGMAFGTGNHPTTFTCLEEIERLTQQNQLVYDIGCGSGILAIAAGRLGAARVLAVDNDPLAVEVCRENIMQNNLQDKIQVRCGSVEMLDEREADLILMNILPHVILHLVPKILHLMKPSGYLVAGGISLDKGDKTKDGLEKLGLQVLKANNKGEWVTFTLGRC